MTETPAASTGWVWAPREPCPEQIKGIEFAIYRYSDCSAQDAERGAPHAYRAMLAAAPARVLSEEDWQPIATAPKDGTEVLGYLPVAKKARVVLWRRHWEQWQMVPGYYAAKPTHWQPLPKPPALAALSVDETIEGK